MSKPRILAWSVGLGLLLGMIVWGLGVGMVGCASSVYEITTTLPDSQTTTSTSPAGPTTTAATATTSTTIPSIAGSWEAAGDPGLGSFSPGGTPALVTYRGSPFLAFASQGNEYLVLQYNGSNNSWESSATPIIAGSFFSRCSLYIYDDGTALGRPYASLVSGPQMKISVKKYDRGSGIWENIGESSLTPETYVYNCSLAVHNDGTIDGQPYLAYSSGFVGSGIRSVVRKYNKASGQWDILDNKEFETANPADNALALSLGADGVPYLCFVDYWPMDVHVSKYSANKWAEIGSSGSLGFGSNVNIKIYDAPAAGAVPFVAFARNTEEVVSSFPIGSANWSRVIGTNGFTPQPFASALFVDHDVVAGAVPYISFAEASGVSLMKYNGGNWTYIGNPGFGPFDTINFTSLIVSNGTPFIAYKSENSGKISVYKFTVK